MIHFKEGQRSSAFRFLSLLVFLELLCNPHQSIVAAAGYSCNGQTFSTAQTVTIQVASDTSLSIQGCKYNGGLTIATNPASGTLGSFQFSMDTATISGTLQLQVNLGSGAVANITSTRVGSIFRMTGTLGTGAVLGMQTVTGGQFSWTTSMSGILEVIGSTFSSGGHTVSFSGAPTSGSDARQIWTGNTISTTANGYYAMYYTTSDFSGGAVFQLSGNTLNTASNIYSYGLSCGTAGGVVQYDVSNWISNGGVSIVFRGASNRGSSVSLRGSFVAPISISLSTSSGDLYDSVLEVINSTVGNGLSITGSGNLTNCAINILGTALNSALTVTQNSLYQSSLSINGTAISGTATLTFSGFLASVFLRGATGNTDVDVVMAEFKASSMWGSGMVLAQLSLKSGVAIGSTLTFASSTLAKFMASSFELRGSVLEVSATRITRGDHTVHFTGSPSTSGTVQRWIGNTISSTANGYYAMYYTTSTFFSGAVLQMSGNSLTTASNIYSYALAANFDQGTIQYDSGNRIKNGGVSITATGNLTGAYIYFASSSFVAPVSISASKWLVDSYIALVANSVGNSVTLGFSTTVNCSVMVLNHTLSAAFSLTATTMIDSTLSYVSNVISAVSLSTAMVRSTLCYFGNTNSGALTLDITANQGTTLTVGNSTINGGISVTAPLTDSLLRVVWTRASSFSMTTASTINTTVSLEDNTFQGGGHTVSVSQGTVGSNSVHRFARNTIVTTANGYYAVYYTTSDFGTGSLLWMTDNTLRTASNIYSYALSCGIGGGKIIYESSNSITNGGVSIGFRAVRHSGSLVSLRGSFVAPVSITAAAGLTDTVLEVINSTVGNGLSITGSGNFTNGAINILGTALNSALTVTQNSLYQSSLSINSTAISGTATLTFSGFQASVFLRGATGNTDVDVVMAEFKASSMWGSGMVLAQLSLKSGVAIGSTLTLASSTLAKFMASSFELRGSVLEVSATRITRGDHTVHFTGSPSTSGTVQRWIGNTISSTANGYYAMYYTTSDVSSNSVILISGNTLSTASNIYSYALAIRVTTGSLLYTNSNRVTNGGISIVLAQLAGETTVGPHRIELSYSSFVAPVSITFTSATFANSIVTINNCSGSTPSISGASVLNTSFTYAGNIMAVDVSLTGTVQASQLSFSDNPPTPTGSVSISLDSTGFNQGSLIRFDRNRMTAFTPTGSLTGSTMIMAGNTISGALTLGAWSMSKSYFLIDGNSVSSTMSRTAAATCTDTTWTVSNNRLGSTRDSGKLGSNCAFRFLGNTVRGSTGAGGGLTLAPAAVSAVVELLGNVFQVGGLSISGTADTVQMIGNRFESDPSSQITLAAVSGVNGRLAACNTLYTGGTSVSVSSNSFTNEACISSQTYARCAADPAVPVTATATEVSASVCNTTTDQTSPTFQAPPTAINLDLNSASALVVVPIPQPPSFGSNGVCSNGWILNWLLYPDRGGMPPITPSPPTPVPPTTSVPSTVAPTPNATGTPGTAVPATSNPSGFTSAPGQATPVPAGSSAPPTVTAAPQQGNGTSSPIPTSTPVPTPRTTATAEKSKTREHHPSFLRTRTTTASPTLTLSHTRSQHPVPRGRSPTLTPTASLTMSDTSLTHQLLPSRTAVPEEEPPLLPPTAVTAAAAVSVIASVAGVIGAGAAAADMQSVFMLGQLSCASPGMKQALSGSAWLVNPLEIGPPVVAKALGSFVIVVSVLLVNGTMAFIISLIKKQPFAVGAAACRQPQAFLFTYTLLLQGLWIESIKLFFAGPYTRDPMMIGTFGALLSVVPLFFGLKFTLNTSGFRGVFTPYKLVLEQYRPCVRRFLPGGFWGPADYRSRFSILFAPYLPGRTWFAPLPWIRTILLGIIAMINLSGDETICEIQIVVMAAIFGLFGLAVLIARPYRLTLTNAFVVLNSVCVAVVSGLSKRKEEAARQVAGGFLICVYIFSIASAIHSIVMMILERLRLKKQETQLRAERKIKREQAEEAARNSLRILLDAQMYDLPQALRPDDGDDDSYTDGSSSDDNAGGEELEMGLLRAPRATLGNDVEMTLMRATHSVTMDSPSARAKSNPLL